MITERNKAIAAVYAFLKRGNAILLMRRKNTGYYDQWYSVPSGHVEAGELPIAALVREAAEEVGIAIDPNDARLVHVMYRTKHDETADRVDFFYEISRWQGEVKNAEPDKCDDLMWFSVDTLPENFMHHQRWVLNDAAKGIMYSEYGLDRVAVNPTPRR